MANEVRFNEGWIGRVGTEVGEGMGCLDLWVGKDGLQVKQLASGDEVGEINMNGHFAGPSGVKYALGEDVLGDDGVLFVRASFWNYQLDRIKKLNVSHGMRMRIYGTFRVDTYPRQDGTTGKSVRVNVNNFTFSFRRDGQTSTSTPTETTVETNETSNDNAMVDVPF